MALQIQFASSSQWPSTRFKHFPCIQCIPWLPISRSTIHRYHSPCRNRPLRGFATRGEMRLRRSRQVGRGRRPSREATARARANTPSVSECREVPAETGEAIEEAELEEVADAEIGDSVKIARQFVVLRFARIGPDSGLQTLYRLLRFALGVAAMFLLPPIKRVQVVIIEHNCTDSFSPSKTMRSSIKVSAYLPRPLLNIRTI